MVSFPDTRVFNRRDRFAEGWYFALPSGDLRNGRVKALTACSNSSADAPPPHAVLAWDSNASLRV